MQAFKKTKKKKKRKLLQVFKAQRPARMECRSRPSGPQPATDKKQNKSKRTKSQKRICRIKRKRTKLYLSWSVLSSDQSLQM